MSKDINDIFLKDIQSQNSVLKSPNHLSNMSDFERRTLPCIKSQNSEQPILNHSVPDLYVINPTQSLANIAPESTSSTVFESLIETEFHQIFAIGRVFQSMKDFRKAAYDYGRKYNVALTTSRSCKTKLYLICKHGGYYRHNSRRSVIKPYIRKTQKTGCPCMIYARSNRDNFWVVRKSVGEHNHPIAKDPQTYAMYRSFSSNQLEAVRCLLRKGVATAYIMKALEENGVVNILPKDIEIYNKI